MFAGSCLIYCILILRVVPITSIWSKLSHPVPAGLLALEDQGHILHVDSSCHVLLTAVPWRCALKETVGSRQDCWRVAASAAGCCVAGRLHSGGKMSLPICRWCLDWNWFSSIVMCSCRKVIKPTRKPDTTNFWSQSYAGPSDADASPYCQEAGQRCKVSQWHDFANHVTTPYFCVGPGGRRVGKHGSSVLKLSAPGQHVGCSWLAQVSLLSACCKTCGTWGERDDDDRSTQAQCVVQHRVLYSQNGARKICKICVGLCRALHRYATCGGRAWSTSKIEGLYYVAS